MATSSDRASYFPTIEKKYGQPMQYWFDQMEMVAGKKYPEQIAFLKENHGFTQTHANALVMYCRGSKTTKRFSTFDDYLAPFDAQKQTLAHEIFDAITQKYPKLELVIAWNKPMLKMGDDYIFGISVHSKHILLAPWGDKIVAKFADRLSDYETNIKTVRVPLDWKVDKKLLRDMVAARLAELKWSSS